MDVSIIIVNYNTTNLVIDCLNTVYKYTKDLLFEVIVVDNNSPDRSIENLNDYFPQVKLVLNDENSGFGSANNLGNKYAIGKYLFLLNSDTILLNNAIKSFFDFMEKTPDAGVCGGNLLTRDLKPNASFEQLMPSLSNTIDKLFFSPYQRIKFGKNRFFLFKEDPIQIEGYIIGADYFVRKDVYDLVKGFDEDFFMYAEEAELTYRIKKIGYKSYVFPSVKIIHLDGSSSVSKQKEKWIKNSLKLYFEKTENNYIQIILFIENFLLYRKRLKLFVTKRLSNF